MTDAGRHPLVEAYLSRLYSAAVYRRMTVEPRPWYSDVDVELLCIELPTVGLPRGFSFSGMKAGTDVPRFQYDLGLRDGKRYRPVAYRVPFLEDAHFGDESHTVSHLCHNPACYNPAHHVFETLEVNKGRNGCPGGPHCHHRVTCLRPGMYHSS